MTDMTPYQEMAASIGLGDSKMAPELFAMIVDQEEAKVVLAASPPKTVSEIAAEVEMPEDKTQELLEGLFVKGLIYKSKKPDATRYYKFRSFIQFHDGTVLTPGISQEYLDAWQKFEEEELEQMKLQTKDLDFRQGMRVVPVNVAIESQSQIAVFEDVAKMIDEAEKIAVTNCSCRVIHGITDVPLEVCMQMNKAAHYALERGTGRELTRDEAMDMLRMCEEEGLVHTVDNKLGMGYLICNCDKNGCGNWGPAQRAYAKKFCAPSRFKALVDADACSSCETCVDRCFFDAITMTGENDTALVDAEKCMGCGLCVPTCPEECISYEEMQPQEFIPE